MSDYTLGDTIYHKFTTRAFATGVPTALAGSPTLEIYENDSITPIVEGALKLVLTQNLNSINGYNLATITATTGNGFEAGKSYSLMLKTGTVGGTSIVGEAIWEFTLNASAAFTRLGAPAGASIAADIATKMATYTQPTGFLAATFPTGTVANTTNITAGTMTTTTNLTTNNDKTGYALSVTGSAAMTEDYPADGATGTLNQLLYLVLANIQEFAISGTTLTAKKLDGTTTAATYTLDSATSPTSRTRAT